MGCASRSIHKSLHPIVGDEDSAGKDGVGLFSFVGRQIEEEEEDNDDSDGEEDDGDSEGEIDEENSNIKLLESSYSMVFLRFLSCSLKPFCKKSS